MLSLRSPNKLYITFISFFLLLCSDYVADLIKKLELCLTLVSVLLKTRFGPAQISAQNRYTMSKTPRINPCKHESLRTDIGNDKIWESNNVKLLEVSIDRDLKFNGHMLNICSKANRKLTILSRMFK